MLPISAPGATGRPDAAWPVKPAHHGGFREFLSELNPLQYIPVIGTLYRAITGDTIPDTAREAGSLVVSGLTGGPIGVALNLGALAVERLTGIDPEKIARRALSGAGAARAKGAPRVIVTEMAADTPQPAASGESGVGVRDRGTAHTEPGARGWSRAQLVAYGVTTDAQGALRHGAVTGSDVLNDLELARHTRNLVA